MSSEPVLLDERAARNIVLVQAVETVDLRGALVSEVERDAVERELLHRRGIPAGQAPDAAWYLPARAAELVRILGNRQPGLVRVSQRGPWWARLDPGVPLLAFVLGLLSDRIGNPHQLNLLSLPLLGFVLWNLVVYLLLAVSVALPVRSQRHDPVHHLLRELSAALSWLRGHAGSRWRALVWPQFHLLWWRVAGALEGARLQRMLHFSAAAWALGVAVSLVWAGLATQYRVGWESTWLDAPGVHWLVSMISAPGRGLLGVEAFSLADIERLQFGAGAEPAAAEARRWALLYVAFLGAVVVLPRLLLGLWSGWQARRLGRQLRLDLEDAYFQQLMDRVSPVSVTLGLATPDARLRQLALSVLRQGSAGSASESEPMLVTEQGDRLQLAPDDAPAPPDLVWALATDAAAGAALPPPRVAGQALLLLCGDGLDAPALGARARALGWRAEALPLRASAACWALEGALRDAVVRLLPASKRAGVQRLAQSWAGQHGVRWQVSRRLLATALAASCRDEEPVLGRWPGRQERQEAMTRLLERLQARLDGLHGDLLRANVASALREAWSVRPQEPGLAGLLSQPSAGAAGALAGAAAGVLAGAKVDLLTGGLTMGAGAALGALIGGAGAFGAARWWDLGGAVRLSDEQLQALAASLVTQYLAVVHADRAVQAAVPGWPPQWHAEAVAVVAEADAAWRQAWKDARQAGSEDQAAQTLAGPVAQACQGVLRRLYPGQQLAPLQGG